MPSTNAFDPPRRPGSRNRRPSPRRALAFLVRDRRGTPAIEFAFAAPVIIAFVLAILELSLHFTARTVLNGALGRAVEAGTVSGLTDAQRQSQVSAAFLEHLPSFLPADAIVFEQHVYDSLASVGQPEPFDDADGSGTHEPGESFTDINGNGRWDQDRGVPGAGGPQEVVRYRVRHAWQPLVSLTRSLLPEGGIVIELSQLVRNEP